MNLEEMQSRCPDELASLRACAQLMWEKMTRGQKALLRMGMTDIAIHNEMVERDKVFATKFEALNEKMIDLAESTKNMNDKMNALIAVVDGIVRRLPN